MIGRIFRTFGELMERPQVMRDCVNCGRQFMLKDITNMFCRPACVTKYMRRPANQDPEPIGPIYHGAGRPGAEAHQPSPGR